MRARHCRPAPGRLALTVLLGWLPLLALPMAAAGGPMVRDDAGATVRLPSAARRIVSLAPHATELLFFAGAGSQLVGVSRHSDFPPAARALPRIGDSAGVDLEALAALHPDLVVAWGSALPPRTAAALQRLGIAVYRSEPHTLQAIADDVERLAVLAGRAAPGAAAAAALRVRIAALRRAHAGVPPLQVFVQVWPQPLMTVNGDQVISDALRACGAHNLFEAQSQQVPVVDPEAVVQADPDAIVGGVDGGETGAGAAAFARWHALPRLRAVAGRHLVGVDDDLLSRPGPRFIDAAEALCRALDAVRAGRPLAELPAPVRP